MCRMEHHSIESFSTTYVPLMVCNDWKVLLMTLLAKWNSAGCGFVVDLSFRHWAQQWAYYECVFTLWNLNYNDNTFTYPGWLLYHTVYHCASNVYKWVFIYKIIVGKSQICVVIPTVSPFISVVSFLHTILKVAKVRNSGCLSPQNGL